MDGQPCSSLLKSLRPTLVLMALRDERGEKTVYMFGFNRIKQKPTMNSHKNNPNPILFSFNPI